MEWLSLLIIGAVIIFVFSVLLVSKTMREKTIGICATALDQTIRKDTNKEKILAFLRQKVEAGNEDIRKYLEVSGRTAVRYLDELEREGKVKQVGKTGHAVTYRLK